MKSSGQCFHERNLVIVTRYLFSMSKSQLWEQRGNLLKRASINSFATLHPQAVIPPDIRTCRAFLEWVSRGMNGRIEERPTVETIQGFFRKFATGMKRKRNFEFPPATRTTINEVCTSCILK